MARKGRDFEFCDLAMTNMTVVTPRHVYRSFPNFRGLITVCTWTCLRYDKCCTPRCTQGAGASSILLTALISNYIFKGPISDAVIFYVFKCRSEDFPKHLNKHDIKLLLIQLKKACKTLKEFLTWELLDVVHVSLLLLAVRTDHMQSPSPHQTAVVPGMLVDDVYCWTHQADCGHIISEQ